MRRGERRGNLKSLYDGLVRLIESLLLFMVLVVWGGKKRFVK